MWICPHCKKSFKNVNQWHSCSVRKVEDHLINKPPHILEAYHKLESIVTGFGEVQISPVKTSIQYRIGANFASVRITGKYLEIEFQLDHEELEFPIHKTIKISSNSVFHAVMVEDPEEINKQLVDWLQQSYRLVKG